MLQKQKDILCAKPSVAAATQLFLKQLSREQHTSPQRIAHLDQLGTRVSEPTPKMSQQTGRADWFVLLELQFHQRCMYHLNHLKFHNFLSVDWAVPLCCIFSFITLVLSDLLLTSIAKQLQCTQLQLIKTTIGNTKFSATSY